MPTDGAPSHLFVIFGATGDLARRKLLPAVYRLSVQGELENRWSILGVARSAEFDDASFRSWARDALLEEGIESEAVAAWCDRCLFYQSLSGDSDGFGGLKSRIETIEAELQLPGNRLFYLALPPAAFRPTIEGLGNAELHRGPGWTRLVLEKPFGTDLPSARSLNAVVHEWFDESQVYRIDHYLGKETVQNLLVFRFANYLFESVWNRNGVDSVQITVAEDVGVENRAGYYDHSGALRDMIQNHLTQLLSLVTMDAPVAYEADYVRNEKIKVLRAVRPLDPGDVVLGQYGPGRMGDESYAGYREAEGIPADSRTPTFVALRLQIDNWRWQGVPFFLRTGKRLPRRVTEIAVSFRQPPVSLFKNIRCAEINKDVLVIRLQPDEGFSLHIDVKRPGEPPALEKLPLHFQYAEAFGPLEDAYVTLLLDVLEGDQTLFVHADEVETAWALYDPLLAGELSVHPYPAGSWGPKAAGELVDREGFAWATT
jgi:glucose-6-phosphate 1-dehydrogenase